MSSTSNLEQWERDLGTGPCNRFPWRFKVCKAQDAEKLSGIVPCRLFLLKFNTLRVLVIVFKHEGIDPEKLLKERSRR
jgi:hypothetical protein